MGRLDDDGLTGRKLRLGVHPGYRFSSAGVIDC